MRALLLTAFVVLTATATATSAFAQSSPNAYAQDYPLARPSCSKALLYAEDWDAIASKPIIRSAPEGQRDFCAFIGLAQEGPWRRYALVEMRGDSWCDASGCALIVFVEDRKGQWKPVMTAEDAPRGLAVSEGVAVDFASPVEGLPAFGIPQRTAAGVDYSSWAYDGARRSYHPGR